VHLQDLRDDELMGLLKRCRKLYATCRPTARLLPDEAIESFLETCRNQIGAARWRVPRIILQRFIGLQERLLTNPNLEWQELLFGQPSENSEMEFEGYAYRQM
jgi:hypothetical protein